MTDLRRATSADAEACADIVLGWLGAQDWMPDPPDREELVGLLRDGIPQREVWVIGDPVAGYLALDTELAQVNGLYCARSGEGLGKALLDRAKDGRDFVQLWTHEPNTRAHRFYTREGFSFAERCAEGRGDGVPELRMEWVR